MTWKTQEWTITDLETTGAEKDCRIVEIGFVWMQDGKVTRHWKSLVNPGIPIPPEATGVHGITDEDVKGAPTFAELLPTVQAYLDNAVIVVGYNIFGFDEEVFQRHGCVFKCPIIDPFAIVRSNHAITPKVGPGLLWESTGNWQPRDPLDVPEPPRDMNRPPSKFSLAGVAWRLELLDPDPSIPPELHSAEWDCCLAGRILTVARHLCSDDAEKCSERLRIAHKRAQAKAAETRRWMYRKELAAHEQAKARFHAMILDRDQRIAELAYKMGMVAKAIDSAQGVCDGSESEAKDSR